MVGRYLLTVGLLAAILLVLVVIGYMLVKSYDCETVRNPLWPYTKDHQYVQECGFRVTI